MNIQMTKEERAEFVEHITTVTNSASGIQMIAGLQNDGALIDAAQRILNGGWEILRMVDPAAYERLVAHGGIRR